MILCGTALRPFSSVGPAPIVRLAADAGFAAIAVDSWPWGGCLLPDVQALAAEAAGAGMRIGLVRAPLPEEKLGRRKRLPHLAALGDKEERLAAVTLCRRVIERTRDLGAALVLLDFGRVTLPVREPDVRRLFARRELGQGNDRETGQRLLDAALADRRANGQALMDACRRALDRLLPVAEAHGAKLLVKPAATPWQVPSPRETMELCASMTGAPIAPVFSPARLTMLHALGLPLSAERREALRKAAALFEATDAVGLEHPLVPGLGEVDLGELPGDVDASPVLLTGQGDATDAEIRAAVAMVKAIKPADPSAAS
jgi:sugar phosphate isomerase/epimerase